MTKIDWYIIRKFITTFFFCIFLFAVISVVIDVSEKTDDFVKSGWSFTKIVMDYYVAFIPHIIALLFPLFVFIAVIFFTSKMAGRSEIIAILAGGVSFRRVLRPFIITSTFLAIILWFGISYVIPRAEVKRTYFEDVYVNGNSSYNPLIPVTNNKYFKVDSFTYAGIHYYDTVNRTGGPFFMHRIKNNQLVYNLRADALRWDTAKHQWKMEGIFERTLKGLKEEVVLTPQRYVNFNFKPSDLREDAFAKDKMTNPELAHSIKLEQLRGTEGITTLLIEKYHRDATPVSVIILTVIGAVVASRKVRGGSGVHLALGIVIAVLFILMDRFSTIFSTKGNLPPLLAAWIPNIVFAFVAWYQYKRAPK